MKKALMLTALCAALALTACGSNKEDLENYILEYNYLVDNGDLIQIALDTSTGYEMEATNPFFITKDEEEALMGIFILSEDYDFYYETVTNGGEGITFLEEGKTGDSDYIFYEVEDDEGAEYDYAVNVSGSETAVIIGGIDKNLAIDCFNHISFGYLGKEDTSILYENDEDEEFEIEEITEDIEEGEAENIDEENSESEKDDAEEESAETETKDEEEHSEE